MVPDFLFILASDFHFCSTINLHKRSGCKLSLKNTLNILKKNGADLWIMVCWLSLGIWNKDLYLPLLWNKDNIKLHMFSSWHFPTSGVSSCASGFFPSPSLKTVSPFWQRKGRSWLHSAKYCSIVRCRLIRMHVWGEWQGSEQMRALFNVAISGLFLDKLIHCFVSLLGGLIPNKQTWPSLLHKIWWILHLHRWNY